MFHSSCWGNFNRPFMIIWLNLIVSYKIFYFSFQKISKKKNSIFFTILHQNYCFRYFPIIFTTFTTSNTSPVAKSNRFTTDYEKWSWLNAEGFQGLGEWRTELF